MLFQSLLSFKIVAAYPVILFLLVWPIVAAEPGQPPGIVFTDVTQKTKLHFRHVNGAGGEKYLIETMGAGCAFLDYNGDGLLDVYFVNSGKLPGHSSGPPTRNSLFKNNGDGTFSDVTRAAGVEGSGYGMGVVAADYDNDGHTDLYVTNYGSSILYRNKGNATFQDVTDAAGVNNGKWGTSAVFFDYDKDGFLDLYVANYVDFRMDNNVYCGIPGKYRSYCHPDEFSGQPDALYRNNGDGSFTDVSERAKIADPAGKGLGVLAADLNGDGYQDLYVANDAVPNFLFLNKKDGTFEEVGVLSGVAYSGDGKAQSGMGTAVGGYTESGGVDLLVTNLSNESYTLYRKAGKELFFADATFPSGVGRASVLLTGWGAGFVDFDNDGDEDIVVANGHVMDNIERINSSLRYLQPAALLESRGGKFVDATAEKGGGLNAPRAGRGLALGDFDNDGDIDILISGCNEPAALFRNDGGDSNRWLMFKLAGTTSNRDGIGARVTVKAGGSSYTKEIFGAGSYLSSHDRRLHFGLGSNDSAEEVKIVWPSGKVQTLKNVAAGQILQVEEP